MPILDYETRAARAEEKLFANENISAQTKRILRRFLIAYDVSPARRLIFLEKIRPLLEHFDHIESALEDRDAINEFFATLRRKFSPANYDTHINVSRRFLSWLNGGERPKSMCDVRRSAPAKAKRSLKPEDMVTWEDGLRIANGAGGTQMRAIPLVQLDGGFRPSEFVDLNYGDVQVRPGLAIITVRDGKTGDRIVVARRCLPALLRWLEEHPTKAPGDPLWVAESSVRAGADGRIRVRRYSYLAMQKRLRQTAQRVGIRKPVDFYNLRHSSCVLDKLDNLPTDLAADRHGHSVKHFTGTYGRLSVGDVVRRFNAHYGTGEEEQPERISHRCCPICQTVNEERAQWCVKCGNPFTAEGAVEAAEIHGFAARANGGNVRDELERMRSEMARSKEREEAQREQQLLLLEQMRGIRQALAGGRGLLGVKRERGSFPRMRDK